MAEFEVARQRSPPAAGRMMRLTSRRGGLRQRRLPGAGRDEHDQHEPERRASGRLAVRIRAAVIARFSSSSAQLVDGDQQGFRGAARRTRCRPTHRGRESI